MLIWFSDGCGTLRRVSQYASANVHKSKGYGEKKVGIEGGSKRGGHNGITRDGQLKPKAGAANKRPRKDSPRPLRTMKRGTPHEEDKSARRGRYRGTLWLGTGV